MDKQNAIQIIDNAFRQHFDLQKFSKFIKELFNEVELDIKTWDVWTEYEEYVRNYRQLCSYTDSSGKVIDVLMVELKRASSRDRARTMQRNFVAKYLSNAEKDAALVAFYGDDPKDWRFSFVKMEYTLIRDEEGKVKPIKELTPAKRFSFLVGLNEPNHTCRSQFIPLIMEEDYNPSIEEIEKAFSIENVTKEFFEKYKELFLHLKESLDKIISKDEYVKKEFENNDISTEEFAKKTLGQLVFIYFLQKKGWLGVEKDEQGRFKPWGSGPRDFLRRLFDKKIINYTNFFTDILEPLFYDGLGNDRTSNNDYHSTFNCKIPFLNGGLFEPVNGYDWVQTKIIIPNAIFEEILNTFDLFNFTIKEDEPLEKEVAVDPEMLGKVFENLLEVKDRKSKGAFYTPREIVHYMCQQSLINYLETNTGIARDDIDKFITRGDAAITYFLRHEYEKRFGNSTVAEEYLLPESITKNYKEIDRLLVEIKIVDPAVGSGAFPVGMLNEIVKARTVLSFISKEKKSVYEMKREIIENCLYGVDIMPSAIEIAKLRFWLSLVVDEEDIKNIRPLPNLDHKLMCGNSLLEEFEGVKLFDERLLGDTEKDKSYEMHLLVDEESKLKKELRDRPDEKRFKQIWKRLNEISVEKQVVRMGKNSKKSEQTTISGSLNQKIKESKVKFRDLKDLHKQFFDTTNRKEKKILAEKIDRLEWELIEATLEEQGNQEAAEKLKSQVKNKSKPFFLWRLYFSDVFQRENPGFDVVIANPPYIFGGNKGISKEEKMAFKRKFVSGTNKINLFSIFIEQGTKLLRNKGFLTYITPNTLIRVTSYSNIREFLVKNTTLLEIMDLDIGIFENVTASTIVFSLKNDTCNFENLVNIKRDMKPMSVNQLKQKEFNNKGFVFNIFSDNNDRNIIDKIKACGNTLGSLCNYIRFGVVITKNKDDVVKDKKIDSQWKKFLEGNEIGPYYIKYRNRYLLYKKELLHRSRTPEIFQSRKIMIQRITGGNTPIKAVYDNSGYYNKESIINVILKEKNDEINKYVLGILNSRLINWFYLKEYSNGSKLTVNLSKEYLSEIPIKTDKLIMGKIINLVDSIVSYTCDDDYLTNISKTTKVKNIECEIDQLVYRLYGLTAEEIKIVESYLS